MDLAVKCLSIVLLVLSFLTASAFALGCNPGASECYNQTSYQTCNSYAMYDPPVDCLAGQTCVGGACQEPIGCSPGTSKCTGASTYKTCSDYAIWGPEQYCAPGSTCSGGQCALVPQCSSPGTTRCAPDGSNIVQVCNSNLQWETQRACDYGCANGYCRTCSAGATRCSDNTHYQTCSSGGSWGGDNYCGQNKICDSGSCVPDPSTYCASAGSVRCSPSNSNMLQKCGSNLVWADFQVCQMGCFYSACRACSTGQTSCRDTDSYYMCNSQGQWGLATSCPTGYVCFLGSCQAPNGSQCSSLGQIRCSPSDPSMTQICGSNYVYMDYVKCGQGCANGACMVCQPGTSYCADSASYKTCGTDGQFTTAIPCPSGQACANGKCAPTAVCTESSRQCVGSTIQVCTGGQWAPYTTCPSDSSCTESQGTAYCKQNAAPTPQPTPTPSPEPKDSGFLGLGAMGGAVALLIVLVLGGAGGYLFFRKKQ
ncbi:Uncharacterised protein [uncultured archaeon]|nr:Uncharacterised protein [uncultured archaeon]